MLTAIRGALGFFTRLPVGAGEAEWEAFRRSPATIPPAGYLIGALAGLAFFLPVQPTTVAAAYVVLLYALTGIAHADGLADLGDALAVHGNARRRVEAMKDSKTGVGGVLLLTVTLIALALGAYGLAGRDGWTALRFVLAAEVGAKLGMALVICYGRVAHEGLGSQLVGESSYRNFGPALLLALPAALFPPFGSGAGLLAALAAGPLVGLALLAWAHRTLGGVNGDAIGAANELGRALALHLGVTAWILV